MAASKKVLDALPVLRGSEGRQLERAVQHECQARAGELVDPLVKLYAKACHKIESMMEDPEIPAAVQAANARFIMEHVPKMMGIAGAKEAELSANMKVVINMEDAIERVKSDPTLARSLLS